MSVASFAPVSSVFLTAGTESANVEVPAGGTIALVTNTSQTTAYVALGTTSTTSATVRADLPVLAQQAVALTVTSAGGVYLAAVTQYEGAGIVVTVGN